MGDLLRRGRRKLRRLIGKPTPLELSLRRAGQKLWTPRRGVVLGSDHAVFWGGKRERSRLGLYLLGGCDLPAIFKAVPLIHAGLDGTCAMLKHGTIAQCRSELVLQTLESFPDGALAEAQEKRKLREGYFEPTLFKPTFRVPVPRFENVDFDKTVIILSIAGDAVRTLYRHRENGFLVDPGGWWLDRTKEQVLEDLETVTWFRKTFESVGRATAESFYENYTKLIPILKERTGAEILVFNVLTVEPFNTTHTYQLMKNAHTRHRREMNVALWELARRFDISVIDVDRVLKDVGIQKTQMDFAHYPPASLEPIAKEIVRVLHEREVV